MDLNEETVIAYPWKDNIPPLPKDGGRNYAGRPSFDFEPSPSVPIFLFGRLELGWESATIALRKPEGDRNPCARPQQGLDPVSTSTCTTGTCSPVIYSAGVISKASST